MAQELQELFNECLERVNRGESIESCLLRYPEHAAELQILLSTAVNVRWRASGIQPDAAFKARARAQFIAAQYYAQREMQPAWQPRQSPGLFSLQRAWVPALGAVLLLLFSGVGSAMAASNAMPDEVLYPVKIATEQMQLAITFANEDKAELNTQLAEKRSQEIATLATQGKTEYVPAVTQNMITHMEQASIAIAKVEATETHTAATAVTKPASSAPVTPQPAASAPAPQPSQVTPPSPPPPPPPTTGTTDKSVDPKTTTATTKETGSTATTRSTKLKETLNAAASKNLETLQKMLDKAPEKSKPALQKAIDASRDKLQQIKQESNLPKPSATSGTSTDPDKKPGIKRPSDTGSNKNTDRKPNDNDDND